MDLTTLLGGDLMKWLQLFMFGRKLQQDRREEERAEEDDKRVEAALQRPSIIPWICSRNCWSRWRDIPGAIDYHVWSGK